MTQYARLALQDCEAALQDLRAGPTGYLWRTRWAAAVALLRSVGHVLDRVDKKTSPQLERAVDVAYAELQSTKPEPVIYWEFIKRERDNLLKEYRTEARQAIVFRPGTAHLNLRTGEQTSSPSGPTTYEHYMESGPFAGQDPRDVVASAIHWWRGYLDAIDAKVTSGAKASA
jgi:hypothetical protein